MPKMNMLRPGLTALDTRSAKPPAKTVDPHYSTPEHRRWRNAILTRAAGHCEGIVDGGERCNKTGLLSADHVVELRDGGDPFGAGIALCRSCHATKTYWARSARMAAPVGLS